MVQPDHLWSIAGDNAGLVCKAQGRFGVLGRVKPCINGSFRFVTQWIGNCARQKPAVAGNLNAWRVTREVLASETQAADDRLLQSMLGLGPEGHDVPADISMVSSVATRVWVEHAEAEQKVQSSQSTHG